MKYINKIMEYRRLMGKTMSYKSICFNFILLFILLISIISCTRNNTTSKNPDNTKNTDNNTLEFIDNNKEVIEVIQEQFDDENDFYFTVLSDMGGPYGVSIDGYKDKKKEIRIPPLIGGVPVVTIGELAFDRKNITSVVIPDTVSSIGKQAFHSNQLTEVIIPEGVYSIGESAFRNNQITHITIPDRVSTIGDAAFMDNNLTNVIIGSGIRKIEHSAFKNNQITSLTIVENDHMIHVNHEAFRNNPLSSITLHGLVSYGNLSFPNGFQSFYYDNRYRTGIYTWDGETWSVESSYDHVLHFDIEYINNNTGVSINRYSFIINGINLPDNTGYDVRIPPQIQGLPVTKIERGAFQYGRLISVTIPENVNTIGFASFSDNQLTNIIIPNSVITIDKYAFSDNQLTNIIIPNSVTTIGERAFENNKLVSLTIPDNVTTIGHQAFCNNQIENVVFGRGITTIESNSFFDNNLTSITIPANITRINRYAFAENPITSITISNDVILGDSFPNRFGDFYNSNGKRAGTYTWNGTTWSISNNTEDNYMK
ncbi:MAG: leucine-rich repeat domain-containing protein [Treponema sp.]|jgi:hypothetical protein|nr:leucine-rich repeat domain-containing protein [Treponema sp.]